MGVILLAVATAAGAQVRIPVPGTPVPLTLQVFFVILSGTLLGSRLGAASQALCLAAGLAGLPFFSGGGYGLAYIAGPTGGYLLSFPFAAALAGSASSRSLMARGLACGLALACIYSFGACWLSIFGHLSLSRAAEAGVIPFIGADAMKAAAAAGAGRAVDGLRKR
jgi:biotin transport system substrate-specific component